MGHCFSAADVNNNIVDTINASRREKARDGYHPKFGPPIAINYEPPFSEEPGLCLGRIVESEVGTSPVVVRIAGSFGGCPHQEGDLVDFETQPLFVLPESAVGVIALISSSLAVLAGFVYIKGRKSPSI